MKATSLLAGNLHRRRCRIKVEAAFAFIKAAVTNARVRFCEVEFNLGIFPIYGRK